MKHVTDYNIRCIRFSAYEEDQLVSCGRDSVRFYRLKAGQLRGVSVRLGTPDRKVRGGERGPVCGLGHRTERCKGGEVRSHQ